MKKMCLDTKMGHHNVLSPSDEYNASYPYSLDLGFSIVSYDNFFKQIYSKEIGCPCTSS